MNDTVAATQQLVQFHAGPLFWILAVATVVGCFVVVGRESVKGTQFGISLVVISLGGLFAMTSAVIPAIFFVIPGIFLFAPLVNSSNSIGMTATVWRGVRPALALVICAVVALLTITLIQGTRVWLYAGTAAEEASLSRLWVSFGGTYAVALAALAVLAVVALYGCKLIGAGEPR